MTDSGLPGESGPGCDPTTRSQMRPAPGSQITSTTARECRMATHDQVLQEDPPLQLRAEFGDVSRVQSRPRRGSRSGANKREHKRDWSNKEIDGITNPLILVNSALYGAPGSIAVDVTANIQALFDLEYQNNPQLLAFTLP